MNDKKETELDKWLRETKANNLSLEELHYETNSLGTKFYNQIRRELKVVGTLYQHLFNLWNNTTEESPKVETEWQTKRGERVLVWNNNEEMAREAIYFDTDKFVICFWDEKEFENYSNSNCFRLGNYCHMKPLPIEQPIEDKVVEAAKNAYEKYSVKDDKLSLDEQIQRSGGFIVGFKEGTKWQSEQTKETDFKSKFEAAIELIEKRIDESVEKMKASANDNSFQDALAWKIANQECGQLINQIKQL